MTVPIDAGPLIVLARMQRIELLRELSGEVLVPDAVVLECAETPPNLPPFLRPATVDAPFAVHDPCDPGDGELAVIHAALARGHAEWLIMDDQRARKAALSLGLPVIGLAGLLLDAKLRSHISLVGPLLDLALEHGYYLHPRLRQHVLESAGEA